VTTVLVVDDEFGIVQVLADILSEHNYDVLTAVNGRHALERLAQQSVQLVLTDYMMPSLDGPGLVREIRAHEMYRSIPVVVMSSLPKEHIAATMPGINGFLRKPFRVHTVLEAISAALAPAQNSDRPKSGPGQQVAECPAQLTDLLRRKEE